jgi:uncharacterized glyoxalase superfamily protein PhnB
MRDPFDALHQPVVPLAPRAEFAAALRARIRQTLRPTRGDVMDVATEPGVATATGYRSITPYLCVRGAREAITWYVDVFHATLRGEPYLDEEHDRIGHAELVIGDSVIMLADEYPEIGVVAPAGGGTSVSLVVHVPDVDATVALALERGATIDRPIYEGYGSRAAWLFDPFGHRWNVSTPLGELPPPSHRRPVGELGYWTWAVPDVDRGVAFYGGLFGWEFRDAEPGNPSYRHVENTQLPFGLVGEGGPRGPVGPKLWFRVSSIAELVDRVTELGGTVEEVAEYASGGNAVCRDDQGVAFELWQPAPGY